MDQSKAKYYNFLDSLRTIAILLVLLRHSMRPFIADINSPATGAYNLWSPLSNLFINGWVGVDLFFLLSGFLITQSFLKPLKVDVKKFYFNRALRIFPAYFTVLFLITINAFPDYSMSAENPVSAIIYHILFMQDYTGPEINTVFWSLGVEVKFYILSPVLLMFVWHFINKNKWIHAYFFTISIIIISPILRYYVYSSHGDFDNYYDYFILLRSPFHNCIDGLFFGVLLAIIVKHLDPYFKQKSDKIIKMVHKIFILLCILMISFLMSHNLLANITIFDVVFQPTLLSIFFLAIALSGLYCHTDERKHFFANWGSKLSYSTYLVHWPLIPLCLAIPVLLQLEPAHQNIFSALIFAFSLWIISFGLAFLIYRYIEKPFLKLKF